MAAPVRVRVLVPLGPSVVYAPPAFKGQKSAKGATAARFAMVAARLAVLQTSSIQNGVSR